MAILFTKKDAMKELPFIENQDLYKGVDLALWLYLDKFWNLKTAVNEGAKKHQVKPKIAIERLLRKVIPEELILDRMSYAYSKNKKTASKPTSKESAIRGQKIKRLDREAKSHVIDICATTNNAQ